MWYIVGKILKNWIQLIRRHEQLKLYWTEDTLWRTASLGPLVLYRFHIGSMELSRVPFGTESHICNVLRRIGPIYVARCSHLNSVVEFHQRCYIFIFSAYPTYCFSQTLILCIANDSYFVYKSNHFHEQSDVQWRSCHDLAGTHYWSMFDMITF